MKPFLSIIHPTFRAGGLDAICCGLENQTYKDFELIISDCLYSMRKDVVAENSKRFSFPIHHVEPRSNIFPVNAFCRTMNAGIERASGEIAVMTCDYMWPVKDWAKIHAEFHIANRGRAAVLTGPFLMNEMFTIHPDFPKENMCDGPGENPPGDINEDYHQKLHRLGNIYASDIVAGKYDKFGWSAFLPELNPSDDPSPYNGSFRSHTGLSGPKSGGPDGLINPADSMLKNDSIALKYLIDCNGLDEDFDGAHGWQDSELSYRLTRKYGMEWNFKSDALTLNFHSHSIICGRFTTRDRLTNEAMYLHKMSLGWPAVNPHFNMSELKND